MEVVSSTNIQTKEEKLQNLFGKNVLKTVQDCLGDVFTKGKRIKKMRTIFEKLNIILVVIKTNSIHFWETLSFL